MAHELAHEDDGERDRNSDGRPLRLNRRKVVKIGGITAALLATGPLGSAAMSSGGTYRTDFSSGSL